MKKSNNKGFAVSALLYGLLILVFLVIGLLMSMMSITRKNTNNLVYDIEQELNRFSETSTVFVYDENLRDREYIVPHGQQGWYRIELWGAGSMRGDTVLSRGAYTSGVIYLEENDFLYFHIGKQGSQNCASAPYNGGAKARYCGGGATDVRISAGDWFNSDGMKNRIMVAAGSGGSSGDGGTLVGSGAGAGTQETGDLGYGKVNGNFGGGAGYRGGSGASGGSSYISGYAGVNSIGPDGNKTNQTFFSKNGRSYKFYNGIMIPGVNGGKGKAKIEKISSNDANNVPTEKDFVVKPIMSKTRYINETIEINYNLTTSPWTEVQVIKDGVNLVKEPGVKVNVFYKDVLNNVAIGEMPNYVKDGSIAPFGGSQIDPLKGHDRLLIQIDLQREYDIDEIAFFHSQEYTSKSPKNSYIEIGANDGIMVLLENSFHQETNNGVRLSKSDITHVGRIPDGAYYLHSDITENKFLNYKDESTINFDYLTGEKETQWIITTIDPSSFLHKIVNNETKKVLQHKGDNVQNPPPGSYLEAIDYYENFPWKNWIFEPQINGTYRIKPQNLPNYCVEDKNGRAIINTCDTNNRGQQFHLIQTSGDSATS